MFFAWFWDGNRILRSGVLKFVDISTMFGHLYNHFRVFDIGQQQAYSSSVTIKEDSECITIILYQLVIQ